MFLSHLKKPECSRGTTHTSFPSTFWMTGVPRMTWLPRPGFSPTFLSASSLARLLSTIGSWSKARGCTVSVNSDTAGTPNWSL
ncbi:unknown [Enterocloster bolteae CAG:59]|nr:unknown [Enterocloster bolteae CAG:59]